MTPNGIYFYFLFFCFSSPCLLRGEHLFTGLASFMRAGMGNIVTDTATVSKAAITSTFLALRKLGKSSHSSSSSSNSDDDSPLSDRASASAGSDSSQDRAIFGPAKFDEDSAAGKKISSNIVPTEQALHSQLAMEKESVPGFIGMQ